MSSANPFITGLVLLSTSLLCCTPAPGRAAEDPYIVGLRNYKKQDYTHALSSWSQLASKNDCDALNSLGVMYLLGQGVGQDSNKAIEYWTRASKLGDVNAQLILGDIYFQHPGTRFNLCVSHRCGVKQSTISAFKWYSIAEKSATNTTVQRYASQALSFLFNYMSPEEAEISQSLSSTLELKVGNSCQSRIIKLIDYSEPI